MTIKSQVPADTFIVWFRPTKVQCFVQCPCCLGLVRSKTGGRGMPCRRCKAQP